MESGPVFADSSGRRRRAMRYAGLGFTAVLAVCLGAIVVAMTGGPQAPLTHWAVQQPPRAPAGHASDQAAGGPSAAGRSGNGQPSGVAAPPGQGPGGSSPSQGASASPSTSASPTAGPSATATASRTASGSPVPTNKAGKTPPGHTKSPNPHKSASVP